MKHFCERFVILLRVLVLLTVMVACGVDQEITGPAIQVGGDGGEIVGSRGPNGSDSTTTQSFLLALREKSAVVRENAAFALSRIGD